MEKKSSKEAFSTQGNKYYYNSFLFMHVYVLIHWLTIQHNGVAQRHCFVIQIMEIKGRLPKNDRTDGAF